MEDWTGTKLEEFVGPQPEEERKPFVPIKYVNPFYRLELGLQEQGYVKQRSKALWREVAPNKVIPWEGDSYVKGAGLSYAKAWVAPVGELGADGRPVDGKWSGYLIIPQESVKVSSGWKDSVDEAVDALLASSLKKRETRAERQARKEKEFLATTPEQAHKHDVELITKHIPEEKLRLELEQQAGITNVLGLGNGVKDAINRLLGEYVSREAGKLRTAGRYHFDEADVDDFLQRYDKEVREESARIGPWPGQRIAPMGSWKEKWRPFVKKRFPEWFRDYMLPKEKSAVGRFSGLDQEMERRGWGKDPDAAKLGEASYTKGRDRAWINQPSKEESWTAHYGEYDEKGELVQSTESKPIDPGRHDMAVEEMLKMVNDEAHRRKLREFWAKVRAPPVEPTKSIEEAIKESMTTTFKGHEVTTENLQAQLSAYNIHVSKEELETALERMLMEGPFDPEFSLVQTGKHSWGYQRPIDYKEPEEE